MENTYFQQNHETKTCHGGVMIEFRKSLGIEGEIVVDESDYIDDDISAPFIPRYVQTRRPENLGEFYELQEQIGEGKFGRVFKCRELDGDGLVLAAKCLEARNPKQRRLVEHEVEVMKQLQHPRIIQLYDVFASRREMVLVMEIVEGGELFERIADDSGFILSEKAVVMIMRQLCEALQFIHAKGIIHLDVKPENILCHSLTSNRIKLIDFGLAQFHSEDSGEELKMLVGTAEFVAPEVINFQPLGFQTDMWSVGVITYILLSGYSPFLGDSVTETYCNVEKGEWEYEEEAFVEVSDQSKDFMEKLLVYQRKARMTAEECLNHPWLARAQKQSVIQLEKLRLKSYVARKRWKKMTHAIVALKRMGWSLEDFWSHSSAEAKNVTINTVYYPP